ncbi:conserved hypothetical integral membrane protein TIGR02206 [Pilibacter termitis]|uniref:Conserved hypothetical integral membrane protein TIGR02206 n=1 Tax=Pilibacter termitis TaxID=263852 RepID=A0A1T4QJQ9_9ENTE|nr:TIGR02206 family membrane protein [Pilibacter termitis]SKA04030.1 conserved hypothetical integral membrane protein TIGR02206 [Pilibacter termitis]
MNYFFTYRTNIPENIGFGLFTKTHLLILCFLTIIVAFFIQRYLKMNEHHRMNFRRHVVIVMSLSEALRQGSLIVTGQYEWNALPLDLCAFGWMVMFYDGFHSNKYTQEILYSLTLPGAFAALITPNWTIYPVFNLYSMQSFFIHTVLVGYILMRLLAKEFVPNAHELWRSVVFLLITVPIAMIANAKLDTNFFFLNVAAPSSPLEPIQHMLGKFYIFGLLVLLAFAWFLLYAPWELRARRLAREVHV